jgi:hypothetical protein
MTTATSKQAMTPPDHMRIADPARFGHTITESEYHHKQTPQAVYSDCIARMGSITADPQNAARLRRRWPTMGTQFCVAMSTAYSQLTPREQRTDAQQAIQDLEFDAMW